MRKRLPLILAFAIPFVAYLPTLWGTFYYDDNAVFFGHQVRVLAEDPFSVFGAGAHYLPGAPRSIHVFFLLLIYKAFGASPLPYHVFNLTMHCLATVLVFLLLRRFLAVDEASPNTRNDTVPLLGSLLFGLHPIHVENITFVTLGGTDIFYTLWALLSLVCYVWFRDKTLKGRLNYILLAASVVAYAFALMSKESAVAFVLVYPLAEFALRRRGYLWALPHAAVLAFMKRGLLAGASAAVAQVAGAQAGTAGPAELLKGLGFFAKGIFVPYPHMPYIKEFPATPLLYAFVAVTALWLAAGIVTKRRMVTFSAIWFAVLSLPYLFVPTIVSNVAITAERYVYAPSVSLAFLGGFAIAAGWGNERFRPTVKTVVLAVLLAYVVLGAVYFYQAWRTEEAFWRYAARTNPQYVSPYPGLSKVLLAEGRAAEAEEVLREGLQKEKGMPQEFAQTAYALADLKGRQGDLREAESYYMRSLRYAGNEFAFMDMGFLYLDSGKYQSARWAFEGALKIRKSPRALAGLALVHLRLGEKQKAAEYAREAQELARDAKLKAEAAAIIREAEK